MDIERWTDERLDRLADAVSQVLIAPQQKSLESFNQTVVYLAAGFASTNAGGKV
ncbi:hypothetical protein NG798_22815 [Ancylothrix sp. C2]|uniref:hypothetical protein n=1 Tax=Ancylothrix sp. D3o TaxID=2953691 RepID=UPI0021BB397B|nr:hypothetical protein [Ancylothrix sp. D3o]MCT7952634.1 hypothetical protein [Ancylothrix sp. D3o]